MRIDVEGIPIVLEDGDRICLGIQKGKVFEPESLIAWKHFCKRGTTVIDVGAYTGVYSVLASKLGCKVVALEPMPPLQSRFKRNMHLNRTCAELIGAAASDACGTRNLHYNKLTPYTSGASFHSGEKHKTFVTVRTVTLDSLAGSLLGLSAIKIDVERHEPQVLLGAKHLLYEYRPALIVEALGIAEYGAITQALPSGYSLSRKLDHKNYLFEAQ